MVSKNIYNTVALWAGVGRAVKGNSQPIAEAAAEDRAAKKDPGEERDPTHAIRT